MWFGTQLYGKGCQNAQPMSKVVANVTRTKERASLPCDCPMRWRRCMSTVAHPSILTSHAAVDETTTNVSSRRLLGRHSDCGQDDPPSSFRLLVFFSLFPHPVLCHCIRYSTHPWSQAFFIVSIGFVDCCAFPVDCTLSPLCWNGGLQFLVYISVVFFSSKDYLKRGKKRDGGWQHDRDWTCGREGKRVIVVYISFSSILFPHSFFMHRRRI